MTDAAARAALVRDVTRLLTVRSVGLYEFLSMLRSSGGGSGGEAGMLALAVHAATDLASRGSAQINLLRWPNEAIVAGPLPVAGLADPAHWGIGADGHYWALTPAVPPTTDPTSGPVTRRRARTLAEAYAYLELTLPPGQERIDFRRHSTVERDGDELVLRYDGPYEDDDVLTEVAVPLDSLSRADQALSYGDGASALVDAGQWLLMEMAYAAQAQLGQSRAYPDDYGVVARAWESARAAVDEIAKFVPAGADEVPDQAVWTDQGRRARATWPEALRASRLAAAQEEYRRRAAQLPQVWPHASPAASPGPDRMPPGVRPGEALPARTYAEIHAYLDLHPCPCGSADFDRSTMELPGAEDGLRPGAVRTDVIVRYVGECDGCGRRRDIAFRLPARPGLVPGSPERFSYVEDGASRLLDAAEWLAVAEGYGRFGQAAAVDSPVPGGTTVTPAADAGDRAAVVGYLTRAAYAVEEVLKFMPPDATRVPAAAFWSAESRAWADTEPEVFHRDGLQRRRAGLHRLADEFPRRSGRVG